MIQQFEFSPPGEDLLETIKELSQEMRPLTTEEVLQILIRRVVGEYRRSLSLNLEERKYGFKRKDEILKNTYLSIAKTMNKTDLLVQHVAELFAFADSNFETLNRYKEYICRLFGEETCYAIWQKAYDLAQAFLSAKLKHSRLMIYTTEVFSWYFSCFLKDLKNAQLIIAFDDLVARSREVGVLHIENPFKEKKLARAFYRFERKIEVWLKTRNNS